MLDDARAKGATVIPCAPWESGNRVPLHIVTGVTPDMQIAQEEVFGPILPVVSYRDFC
jgi:coniferyl-aldehyde dehydrogenase